MKRKTLALLLVLLVGALTSATWAAPVELALLWYTDQDPNSGDMQIIKAFEKENPDIKVNLIYTTWAEAGDKARVLTASGMPPDVMWIREGDYYSLAASGLLMPIEDFMESDPDFDKEMFFPGVLESAQVEGVQFGLHRDVWSPEIFCNVDWFEEAGLPFPQPGWTYDDLLQCAKKLTDPQEGKFGFGALDSGRASVIGSFGGRYMNEERTEFTLDEPEAMEAIRYMHDFRWVHHLEPQPGELPDWYEPQFRNSQVAMIYWGPWAWADYSENLSFTWDIAPPVAGPAGVQLHMDGLLLGINSATSHPQEAWRLLKFLGYSKTAQTMQVKLGMANPTVRWPEAVDAFYESPVAPKSIENHIATLANGAPNAIRPRLPSEVESIINDAFTRILNDEQDAASAIAVAQEQAVVVLQEIRQKAKSAALQQPKE